MDGYIEQNLERGEKIERIAKPHWIVLVPGAGLALLGLVLGLVNAYAGTILPLGIFALLVTMAALQQIVMQTIYYIGTELGVTNLRVIGKVGLISRNTFEAEHQRVESINVYQSVAGRLLGYGSVTITGIGGTPISLAAIDNPMALRNARLRVMAERRKRAENSGENL